MATALAPSPPPRRAKGPRQFSRHIAAVVSGGKVLALGCACETKCHAEVDAMRKVAARAGGARKLRGATVWSVRWDARDERLTMAMPCASCCAAMRNRGVRRCVYSTWEGGLEVARIDSFAGYQNTNVYTQA